MAGMAADVINLDYHATTPTHPAVWEAMRAAPPGNSSSGHQLGRGARRAVDEARERVAARLGADPDEVIFTSGATESNNLAIFGAPPGPLAGSRIEHSCVTGPLDALARSGADVTWLSVGRDGSVILDALTERIALVAVMRVSHETGAIQPIVPAGPWRWHCDAAQAVGKMPVDFHQLGAATLAACGHKFGAPPGIGLLLLRRGVTLRPHTYGGSHQQGRRPGTEPVALVMGMAAALDIACDEMESRLSAVRRIRDLFLLHLGDRAAPIAVNSPPGGSPYCVNVSFPGLRADQLLMALDVAGVACSAGPACSSGTVQISASLQAMGLPEDLARSALRFSFPPTLSDADVLTAVDRIAATVSRQRTR